MALDYCGGSSSRCDRGSVFMAVGAFHMSTPVRVSLIVCIGCFVAFAIISSLAPHCEGPDNTDCTLDNAGYLTSAMGFAVIGVFLAFVLFCYGITYGLDRFDEW